MKKFITCGIVATLCALALSTQAFATDITKDMSVFAENAEELATTVDPRVGSDCMYDPKTIMLVYFADINDYINTGKLKISDSKLGNYYYVGDVVERSDGKFKGIGYPVFSSDENEYSAGTFTSEYGKNPITYEEHKQVSSIYFHLYSEEIRSIMLANGIDPDVNEVKLLSLNGVGTVYYINNGTDEMIVKMRGIDLLHVEEYFNDTEIRVLNEEFRPEAARLEAERRKPYEDFIKENGEGAIGAGGSDNPNTGGTSSALAGGIALTACVLGVCAAKKKKK